MNAQLLNLARQINLTDTVAEVQYEDHTGVWVLSIPVGHYEIQVLDPAGNMALSSANSWHIGILDTETTEYEFFQGMAPGTDPSQVLGAILAAVLTVPRD